MPTINIHDAKTNLSKLVAAVEDGSETEIIIARNGKPAARLVSVMAQEPKRQRLGVAKGRWNFDYDAFQALDDVVARQFYGEDYEAMMKKVMDTRKGQKISRR